MSLARLCVHVSCVILDVHHQAGRTLFRRHGAHLPQTDNNNPATLDAVFKAAYGVLKPAGVFGVTGHRVMPFADAVDTARRCTAFPRIA